jgi:Flp pilus assembly protein TadD
MKLASAVCGLLLLAVALVYVQTARHGFVNLDDDEYVYANPYILAGLNGKSIVWAFTSQSVSGQWQPITLLSLMADAEISGVKGEYSTRPEGDERAYYEAKGGTTLEQGRPSPARIVMVPPAAFARLAAQMHAVNAALHAANAILLFLLLRAMTGAVWRSALAAAAFAVHPLHVESVAWITERKDVLCGFFGLLTLFAYLWYVRSPGVLRYLAVAAPLALGLMCKPMLVTWTLVFLLLDYWPLKRRFGVQIFLEKVPWQLLVLAFAVVGFISQRAAGAVVSLKNAPIDERLARASLIYVEYLWNSIFPANLAVQYPVRAIESYWPALAAACLLGLLTAAAIWGAKRERPWFAVGWFWYLLTIAPTIGLLRVGSQVRADRFMYLPQIGLCVAVVWGIAGVSTALEGRRRRLAVVAALVLAGWMVCTWGLVACWRNGETLWTRSVQCTVGNSISEYNLGVALRDGSKVSEAIPHFRKAVEYDANLLVARNCLCIALARCQRYDEAIAEYQKVLAIKPDMASVRYDYGNVLARRGQFEAAIEQYRKGLEIEPDEAKLHHNLAVALIGHGEVDAAIAEYKKTLAIVPDDAECRDSLGQALEQAGRGDEAMAQYRKALELGTAQNKTTLVEVLRERIKKCEAGGGRPTKGNE